MDQRPTSAPAEVRTPAGLAIVTAAAAVALLVGAAAATSPQPAAPRELVSQIVIDGSEAPGPWSQSSGALSSTLTITFDEPVTQEVAEEIRRKHLGAARPPDPGEIEAGVAAAAEASGMPVDPPTATPLERMRYVWTTTACRLRGHC